MRLFISTSNQIKRIVKGNVVAYNPYYLVPDDDTTFSELKNVTEVTELWPVESVKEAVEKVKSLKSDIDQKNEQLQGLISQMNVNVSQCLLDIDKVENLIELTNSSLSKANDMKKNIEDKLREITEINFDKQVVFEELNNQIQKLRNECVNNMLAIANTYISDTNRDILNVKQDYKKFTNMLAELDNNIKEYISNAKEEIKQEVDKARQWANNPMGVVVEGVEYSAKHYATLGKFNKESK